MMFNVWKWWHTVHATVVLLGSPHDRYYRCSGCGASRNKPKRSRR